MGVQTNGRTRHFLEGIRWYLAISFGGYKKVIHKKRYWDTLCYELHAITFERACNGNHFVFVNMLYSYLTHWKTMPCGISFLIYMIPKAHKQPMCFSAEFVVSFYFQPGRHALRKWNSRWVALFPNSWICVVLSRLTHCLFFLLSMLIHFLIYYRIRLQPRYDRICSWHFSICFCNFWNTGFHFVPVYPEVYRTCKHRTYRVDLSNILSDIVCYILMVTRWNIWSTLRYDVIVSKYHCSDELDFIP